MSWVTNAYSEGIKYAHRGAGGCVTIYRQQKGRKVCVSLCVYTYKLKPIAELIESDHSLQIIDWITDLSKTKLVLDKSVIHLMIYHWEHFSSYLIHANCYPSEWDVVVSLPAKDNKWVDSCCGIYNWNWCISLPESQPYRNNIMC